jgi:polyhydroxybutyrate depolymerase
MPNPDALKIDRACGNDLGRQRSGSSGAKRTRAIGCVNDIRVHALSIKTLREKPMPIRFLLSVLLLSFCQCAGAGTLTNRVIMHDGLTRNYLEYRPDALATGPLPLVLVLHGGTGTAASAANITRASSHWRVLADAEGFVVAYPNGIDGNWNDCRNIAFTGTPSTADDVGFLRKVVSALSLDFAIDQQRVYVSGASNGGLMSMRLLQEASETFAAAATTIALKANDTVAECREPSNPSTLLFQFGTSDPLILPSGGAGNLSAEVTRDYWLSNLQCTVSSTTESYPDLNPSDGSTIATERFRNCREGTELHVLTATGAGHATPSILYPEGAQQNRDIEWVNEAWSILRTQRLGIDRWMATSFE